MKSKKVGNNAYMRMNLYKEESTLDKGIYKVYKDYAYVCMHCLYYYTSKGNNNNNNNNNIIEIKTVPINVSIPLEAYQEGKEKNLNFSAILTKSISDYTPVVEGDGVKCDFCGEEIQSGNVKWIFMDTKSYRKWSQGLYRPDRVCKVCKLKHNDIPDEEILRKCISFRYEDWKMGQLDTEA